jgi:hypothetical protein
MRILSLLAEVPVDTDRLLFSGYIVWVVGLALTGFLGVAAWALAKWREKLAASAEGALKSVVLSQVAIIAQGVVARMNAIKQQYDTYAADGKITQSEAKALAAMALKEVKAQLGEQGIALLQKTFGWGQTQVDAHIQGVVEQKVLEAKIPLQVASPITTLKTSVPVVRP